MTFIFPQPAVMPPAKKLAPKGQAHPVEVEPGFNWLLALLLGVPAFCLALTLVMAPIAYPGNAPEQGVLVSSREGSKGKTVAVYETENGCRVEIRIGRGTTPPQKKEVTMPLWCKLV